MKKINFTKRIKWALPLALGLALLTTVVVVAITIIVDGNREAAWSGSGGQTPGSVTDSAEASIIDSVDIEVVQWTNDQTNFYFLIDVYAAAPLMPDVAPINICLDTDNNLATDIPVTNTIQRNRCSYGTGVSGIDTVVEVYRIADLGDFTNIFDVTTEPRTNLGAGTLGYNPSATTPVIEISAPVALLGFGPGNCPASIPMVVYYEGGDADPDDNLPNSGSTTISCGSPTAITLENLSARSSNSTLLVGLVAALLLVAGTWVLVRRTHKSQT